MPTTNKEIPVLGIIVPCFNEEAIIAESANVLHGILRSLIDKGKIKPVSFLVFVDDGSTDRTWELMSRLAKESHSVRAVKLSANYGHQFALLAGLNTFYPLADALLSIDADLQDDPSVIEHMIDNYSAGSDIVYGVRKKRNSDTFFKRNTAALFYRLMQILGVRIINDHADFRLISRRVGETLCQFTEDNLFLRGIFPLMGFSHSIVHYDRKERTVGASKYSLFKMISFAWEGITSFSVKPLYLVTIAGFIIFAISIAATVFVIFSRLFLNAVPGWASIVLPMYFLGGIQLLAIGIIGEYLGKIYKETKRRPRYIIEDIIQ
jgi:glycosyltransferase involved in cell wall biosynthesis